MRRSILGFRRYLTYRYSCWTTLGLAVRTAQSIGLHVESQSRNTLKGLNALDVERRRRIWYSIYVLDRLLSLQLGRPPAIHDDDCDVPLPSRRADQDIDWSATELLQPDDGPSTGDYFIAVIAFSRILGSVLRGLYGPKKELVTRQSLQDVKELDKLLIGWKQGLPRKLRFDLGHAFDGDFIFKRQVSGCDSLLNGQSADIRSETCWRSNTIT